MTSNISIVCANCASSPGVKVVPAMCLAAYSKISAILGRLGRQSNDGMGIPGKSLVARSVFSRFFAALGVSGREKMSQLVKMGQRYCQRAEGRGLRQSVQRLSVGGGEAGM